MYKVMIVEDEQVITEGIVNLIDWESLNCLIVCQCSNGLEALEYINENEVDILVSDIKMPGMNGLELIKRVKEIAPNTKSIMLTAYSEFDYAQKALRYGALDFIMKNDFINELPKAVQSACESIENLRNTKSDDSQKNILDENEIRSIKSYIIESIALSKFNNNPSQIEKYGLDKKKYCLCSCEIVYYDKQHKAAQKTIRLIEDILNITFKPIDYYVLNEQENSVMIVISEEKDKDLSIENIVEICDKTLIMVKEFMNIDIRIGISEVIQCINRLNVAYEQAQKTLSKLVDSDSKAMAYKEEHNTSSFSINIAEFKTNITEKLLNRNYEAAFAELDILKRKVVEVNRPFQKCKNDVLNIGLFILKKLEYYNTEEEYEIKERELYSSVENSKTNYSLFQVVVELMNDSKKLLQSQNKVKSYLINSIDQYIKENYSSTISLEEISETLHVSKSYICRIYKKKMGITFSEAINRYRIDQAKELLKNPSYKVYEIGFMIGIQDPAYFTTLFKKYVGCSPTTYRNRY